MITVKAMDIHNQRGIIDLTRDQAYDLCRELEYAMEEATDHETTWPVTIMADDGERSILTLLVASK